MACRASTPPSPPSCGSGPSPPGDYGHSTREMCRSPRPDCSCGAAWYHRQPQVLAPHRAGHSCASNRNVWRSTASRSQAPYSAKCSRTRQRDSSPRAVRCWVRVCSSQQHHAGDPLDKAHPARSREHRGKRRSTTTTTRPQLRGLVYGAPPLRHPCLASLYQTECHGAS